MNIQTLSRKEKRARIAKAAKLYGIKGEESLALHEAYMAIGAGDIRTAVQLAHPVTKSHPKNAHGWIILGAAALKQREGRTAKAFFGKALESAPKDPSVLGGIAKGHILDAEVEPAMQWAERAIRAGNEDAGLILLYLQLMSELGLKLAAADVVIPVARKLDSAPVSLALGNILAEAEETDRAAEFLDRAWRLDPLPEEHRIARLTALLYQVRLDECLELGRVLLATVQDRDPVAVVMMMALRVQRRLDDVLAFADDFDFATPQSFARARGIVSNVLQDREDHAGAEAAYQEAMHATGSPVRTLRKSYGVFLYRAGDYSKGFSYFLDRFTEEQRNRLPLANSEPAMLAERRELLLVSEQGIGDQVALLALLRIAPVAEDCKVTFIGEQRHEALLRGNALGVEFLDVDVFLGGSYEADPRSVVYIGDLTRYLGDHPRGAQGGAFLVADPKRRDHLRRGYEAKAGGAPIIGVAWASRSLVGRLRSLELAELCRALPEGALVVNLQYGDCSAEIAAAQAARPDLSFVTDPGVDQMADLAGFAAQIMAVDRVVTIDNTTAHLAGALGHPDAHMLVPAGSECMWYWGAKGSDDQWYGTLHLHRQVALSGNWDKPLAEIRALPRP